MSRPLATAQLAEEVPFQVLLVIRLAHYKQPIQSNLNRLAAKWQQLHESDIVKELAEEVKLLLRLCLIHKYLIPKNGALILNVQKVRTFAALFDMDVELTDVDPTGVPTAFYYKTKRLVEGLSNRIAMHERDLTAAIKDTEECLTPVKGCSPQHATKPQRPQTNGDFASLGKLIKAATREPPIASKELIGIRRRFDSPVGGLNKGRNRRVFDFNKGRRSLYTPGINKVRPGGGIEQSPKRKLREFAKDGAKESSEVRLRRMVKLAALVFSAALSVYAASL